MHISQLRKEGRVKEVSEVVKRGQRVKVKVLGITGSKISLSMKVCSFNPSMFPFHLMPTLQDVDQRTGEDLNPVLNKMLVGGQVQDGSSARNPDR